MSTHLRARMRRLETRVPPVQEATLYDYIAAAMDQEYSEQFTADLNAGRIAEGASGWYLRHIAKHDPTIGMFHWVDPITGESWSWPMGARDPRPEKYRTYELRDRSEPLPTFVAGQSKKRPSCHAENHDP